MRRREFISFIGGAVVAPLSARAEQPAVPVIGFLRPGPPEASANLLAAFRKGLAALLSGLRPRAAKTCGRFAALLSLKQPFCAGRHFAKKQTAVRLWCVSH